jgi:hypothetical protein
MLEKYKMALVITSNLFGIFFPVIIFSIIGLFLAYGLSKRGIKYTDSIGLKNLEILTIIAILLLFNTMSRPLPTYQINPSISFITYIYIVTLLLTYILYIEDKVGSEKDEPVNKFKITKILLNKIPRTLFSIVLILWVFSYIYQSTITLNIIVLLLYSILVISIIYIGFTFSYIFYVETPNQKAKTNYDESKDG